MGINVYDEQEPPKITDFYGGKDPRDIPTYTQSEVAHLAGVSVETLRYWIKTRPIILKPDPESTLLSFTNVLEAFRLALLRRRYGVSLRRIRPAVRFAKDFSNLDHPLADQDFETDGTDLFIRDMDQQIVNASRQGQIVIGDFVRDYLMRVERDENGRTYRLYPLARRLGAIDPEEISNEPKVIMVDPRISFGRPALVGSGIPTDVIADFFDAGDSVLDLAKEYACEVSEIESAIRFERRSA